MELLERMLEKQVQKSLKDRDTIMIDKLRKLRDIAELHVIARKGQHVREEHSVDSAIKRTDKAKKEWANAKLAEKKKA